MQPQPAQQTPSTTQAGAVSMKHESALTQAAFDSLLAWPDRDRAAGKYGQIRQRLIKLFT